MRYATKFFVVQPVSSCRVLLFLFRCLRGLLLLDTLLNLVFEFLHLLLGLLVNLVLVSLLLLFIFDVIILGANGVSRQLLNLDMYQDIES